MHDERRVRRRMLTLVHGDTVLVDFPEPVTLADGSTRTFLEDGDEVSVTAWAPGADGTRIGFGAVTGRVLPARP